jgi:2-hydroxy-6-oxonona-2,4-dienedioate hydrolase
MKYSLKKEATFNYIEAGVGTPIIVLHGIMGSLSNFNGVFDFLPKNGYKILIPELPLYTLPLLKTNVKNFALFVKNFMAFKNLDKAILLGNSLGGHIALYFAKNFPKNVTAMVLTGSSGLYENSMGESYPKRGNYEYIKNKAEEVFYDPKVATKEVVDDVFETVNNRLKLLKTLAIAKSAIRHNMSADLPDMEMPVCLIWGKNDKVTPPNVAVEFNNLFPNSDLYWVDKCGHAPMMEHPDEFNEILVSWLKERKL